MAVIRVTERGGEIPAGAGVTDQDGFPLTEGEYLRDNAWTLWRAALTRAIREGAPPQGQIGVLGVTLFCRMTEIEQLIWPVMTADESSGEYARSCEVREALHTYLTDTKNMYEQEAMGRGRAGSTWWVRSVWNGSVPKPASMQQPVTFSDAEPEPLRLAGDSLPSDIMACLNGRDRMHISELLRMLRTGNAASYATLTVSGLCDALAVKGIRTDSVSIGAATRLGVRREAVTAGVEAEADAEAARIVREAHAVAVTQPVAIGAAADLRDAVTAILEENAALVSRVEALEAENQMLRRQPVSDELIERALAGKQKEIDALTYQVRALRRVRG
jgi:hypothetical protein